MVSLHMTDQGFILVTIDGGAATGKSSTASALAERYGFLHADTGSHYRAITKRLLEKGVSPVDNGALEKGLQEIVLTARLKDFHTMIEIDGKLYTGSEIRTDDVNDNVSRFAALPSVRSHLLDYQRRQKAFAIEHQFKGMVMEGRDIGSVIFPDAPLRIFLSADTQTRISRRAQQGEVDQIEERDRQDSGRKTAPLIKPTGAVEIDTGSFDLSQVVDIISEHINKLQSESTPVS